MTRYIKKKHILFYILSCLNNFSQNIQIEEQKKLKGKEYDYNNKSDNFRPQPQYIQENIRPFQNDPSYSIKEPTGSSNAGYEHPNSYQQPSRPNRGFEYADQQTQHNLYASQNTNVPQPQPPSGHGGGVQGYPQLGGRNQPGVVTSPEEAEKQRKKQQQVNT